MAKQVYIYKLFERFWHWGQAILVMFLALTGFEIHDSYTFFGFEKAVKYHNVAAVSLIVLTVFAIFWHFTTGEWKQYIPTAKKLKEQVLYYTVGIFKGEPHPTQKTTLSKLNPLQRLVYLGLKIVLFPLVVLTGILYLYYRYPQKGEIFYSEIVDLETIAVLHTLGAFLLVTFLIAHLYLITTGHTVTSNLEAMITGYEELESDHTIENQNNKEEMP
jgi:thiosulfate reductase cytochrome b subunit